MIKVLIAIVLINFSSLVYARPCDECLEVYNYEWSACQGDEICRTRAHEKYIKCQLGCDKK